MPTKTWEGTPWGKGNVYLDCGGGCVILDICQDTSNYTLKITDFTLFSKLDMPIF